MLIGLGVLTGVALATAVVLAAAGELAGADPGGPEEVAGAQAAQMSASSATVNPDV